MATLPPLIDKALYVLCVIGLPMAAGYAVRRGVLRRAPGAEASCSRVSRRLKLVCIGVLVPPIAVSAMIRAPLAGANMVAMAALGIWCLLVGALLGRLYVSARRLPAAQGGALLGCAAMCNVVSFGGLVVFAFWGNRGLQQLYLFKIFEHVVYFGVFYPWCAAFAADRSRGGTGMLGTFRRHPITLVPIAAVAVGLTWNLLRFGGPDPPAGPPPWTQHLNPVLVPLHVAMLTFAVGLTLSPSRVGRHATECLAVSVIGFLARPLLTALAAWPCLAMGWINDLGLRVAVAVAAMPVAFNALIPPALFGLDEDLANSCWIVTTAAMVVVVPLLYLVLV